MMHNKLKKKEKKRNEYRYTGRYEKDEWKSWIYEANGKYRR